MRTSARKLVTAVIGTLALTAAAVLGGAVPASANTVSCSPAGGGPGMTISACIEVKPQTNMFEGEAQTVVRTEVVMALLFVTQICDAQGARCGNLNNTLLYSSWSPYEPASGTSYGKENYNSFSATNIVGA